MGGNHSEEQNKEKHKLLLNYIEGVGTGGRSECLNLFRLPRSVTFAFFFPRM